MLPNMFMTRFGKRLAEFLSPLLPSGTHINETTSNTIEFLRLIVLPDALLFLIWIHQILPLHSAILHSLDSVLQDLYYLRFHVIVVIRWGFGEIRKGT